MPGAAPARGGGAGRGRVLFPPTLCSFQASGDRLVPPDMGEAAYFPASTVQCQPPRETLPRQPPQKSRPTWWVMLVNTAPLHGKGSDGSHRPALVLHVSAPARAPPSLIYRLNALLRPSSSRTPVSGQGADLTARGARGGEVPWAPRRPPGPRSSRRRPHGTAAQPWHRLGPRPGQWGDRGPVSCRTR